jgi:predicted GIY-YIG superfamily endonuclease
MKGFVYILQDDNDRYYIGSSSDPNQRFLRHLSGFVFTTHRMKNPKIIFTQEFPTIQKAKSIEFRLKKLKRKDYIKKIIADGYIKMK